MNPLLTKEKIDFFEKNGFVNIDDVLTPLELEELRSFVDQAMNLKDGRAHDYALSHGDYYTTVLRQKMEMWKDSAGISKYAFRESFAQMALELSGADGIVFHHDLGFYKMPGDSKPTWWHQDSPYFPIMNRKGITMWIALDDVNEDNGCMQFLPGTHKLGARDEVDLRKKELLTIGEMLAGTGYEESEPVVVRLKAGSCTFHHSSTYHYAFANVTNKPRRAFAIEYLHDDAVSNGKYKHVEKGELIAGAVHPVLARKLKR